MPKPKSTAKPKPKSKSWKTEPRIILKMPTKRTHSGESTGQDSRISLDRTVYRNQLVRELVAQLDRLTLNTYDSFRFEFLNTKDQIYGLTVGQLEELFYAMYALTKTIDTAPIRLVRECKRGYHNALRRLRQGLVLE